MNKMSRVNPTINEHLRALLKPWRESVMAEVDCARKHTTLAQIEAAKQRRIARALGPIRAIDAMLDWPPVPTLTDGVDYVALNPATGKLEGHVVTDPAVRAMVASALKRMEAS